MTIDLALGSPSAYLDGISLADRRRSGTIYTPEDLARFILDQAGYTAAGPSFGDAPVLDPACGAGVFLCEVLRRVAAQFGGELPLVGARRRALLGFANRNIYGIEIDPFARALALQALRAQVQALAPGPLPTDFLAANIVENDFLVGDRVLQLRPVRRGGFAYVVGNPPYVAATRLDARYKALLRTLFATAFGRLDLYTLFFERSLQLLRPEGVLAFITPDKFLASESSARLRTFLVTHGSVRSIARFRSHKVFPDAAVVPCVTVIDRRTTDAAVRVLSCQTRPGAGVTIIAESSTPRAALGRAAWHFRSPDLLTIVDRLRERCPSLESLALRISAGPATGRDDVYVRPRVELEDVEQELVRPAIRGRDITTFNIADPDLRILLPFDFSSGEPHLVRLDDYPRARRYLERHRQVLQKRHCVRVWGKTWFDLHDQPATDITHAPKIVVPDLAEHCRFAVDHGTYFPLHSAYYIALKDAKQIDYVAAVLNSKVAEFTVRLLAPIAKDGFSRFRRQYLATMPIPEGDASSRKEIVRTARERRLADVDDMACRLFGVTSGELRRVNTFLGALVSGAAE